MQPNRFMSQFTGMFAEHGKCNVKILWFASSKALSRDLWQRYSECIRFELICKTQFAQNIRHSTIHPAIGSNVQFKQFQCMSNVQCPMVNVPISDGQIISLNGLEIHIQYIKVIYRNITFDIRNNCTRRCSSVQTLFMT